MRSPSLGDPVFFPDLGPVSASSGFRFLEACSDGHFLAGSQGVQSVAATGDGKVEFIAFADRTLAFVKSSLGYPAYYPVPAVSVERPQAVLMDLDGTTVRSESFWIWIIQKSLATLLDRPGFELSESDLPFVSGHSVSEHLSYGLAKYCPGKSLESARQAYFEHTRFEMNEILEGRGRADAFTPTEGIAEFLHELKARKVKIGLVTSGLYEKAYPEILSAFKTLNLGDPAAFYDCIITAGHPLGPHAPGTLGELSPKPHPWLYSEAGAVGLGVPFAQRHSVVGIEDSGAGICSVRLAGYRAIGVAGGNIEESGTRGLCHHYGSSFEDILEHLFSN